MSHARPTCSSCKLYRQRACGLTETALLMYSTSVPKSTAGALPEVVVENMFSAYWLWWSIHKRSRPRRSTGLALQVEPFLVDILGRFRVHFDGVANFDFGGDLPVQCALFKRCKLSLIQSLTFETSSKLKVFIEDERTHKLSWIRLRLRVLFQYVSSKCSSESRNNSPPAVGVSNYVKVAIEYGTIKCR